MNSDTVDLLLVRHERTSYNEESRYQGSLDLGLTETGRERARLLRRVLDKKLSDEFVVWSSTLRRSRETATLVFPNREIRSDPRLIELNFGRVEGLTHEEAEEKLGSSYREWVRSPAEGAPPGGESMLELRERLLDWLAELRGRNMHVVVTHLVPIKTLMSVALQVPFSDLHNFRIDPGDWIRLRLSWEHEVVDGGRGKGGERKSRRPNEY